MNDILLIAIVCFFMGRLYERGWTSKNSIDLNEKNREARFDESVIENIGQTQEKRASEMGELCEFVCKNKEECITDLVEIKVANSYSVKKETEIKISAEHPFLAEEKTLEERLEISRVSSVQVLDPPVSNIREELPETDLLHEKLKLEGTKIKERGKFELLFEKGNGNLGLVRKIEKHEIITDYFIKESQANRYNKLVPFKYESPYPSDKSMVEVEYYQNHQSNPPANPIIEKRIIELSEKSQRTFSSLFEHGKFRKLYRNINKIGEGGFGTVFEAYNMIESKKYAIKKIFMNKNSKQIESLLNEIKILNSLSHPNMVKYNTCWLEYAELSEHVEYQRILEELAVRKEVISGFLLDESLSVTEKEYEESYISSKNSDFSFIRSSKEVTKQSIKLKKTPNLLFNDQIDESNTSNSFGLLPVIYIQMELCEHSLAHYIRRRRQIDRIFAYEIMNQLIIGVSYIHANRVVHRDLKPENILFATKNGHIFLKIGDFGLALQIEEEIGGKFLISNTRVGTPSYIAPELYLEGMKKLSEEDLQKADIYSLAVIYYELLNKFDTTHERGEKLSLLKHGKVAGLNEFKEEKKLIQELIRHNRPRARDIYKNQNWKKLSELVGKLKKKNYREGLNKKESTSTNFTSNSSNLTLSDPSDIRNFEQKKSKSKSKNKNKNKKKGDINLAELNHKDFDENEEENKEENEETEKENSDEIELELYKENFDLIRRSSSSSPNEVKKLRNKNEMKNGRVIETEEEHL